MLANKIVPNANGLSQEERTRRDKDVADYSTEIVYSKRYNDDQYEYR